MKGTIEERVTAIVAELLEVDAAKVTPSVRFADLNGDSIALIDLILSIEDEFNFEIPDEEAEKILTVQQAIDYVTGHAR